MLKYEYANMPEVISAVFRKNKHFKVYTVLRTLISYGYESKKYASRRINDSHVKSFFEGRIDTSKTMKNPRRHFLTCSKAKNGSNYFIWINVHFCRRAKKVNIES